MRGRQRNVALAPAPGGASIRVGISGWRYAPWRGDFYPNGLAQRRELEYASRKLPTIELNGSFYSLQRPEAYARWYDETPANFVFAIKGPRYLTHMLRLRGTDEGLANFLASGLFAIDAPRAMRHALEIRHPSFLVPEFIELLRAERVALVVSESAGKWPMPQDVTADFIYLRLHGDEELYRSGYADAALEAWARRIAAWHGGGEPADADKVLDAPAPSTQPRDVYCYFDNTDVKLRAPFDAQHLLRELGVAYVPEDTDPRPPPATAPRRHAVRPRRTE